MYIYNFLEEYRIFYSTFNIVDFAFLSNFFEWLYEQYWLFLNSLIFIVNNNGMIRMAPSSWGILGYTFEYLNLFFITGIISGDYGFVRDVLFTRFASLEVSYFMMYEVKNPSIKLSSNLALEDELFHKFFSISSPFSGWIGIDFSNYNLLTFFYDFKITNLLFSIYTCIFFFIVIVSNWILKKKKIESIFFILLKNIYFVVYDSINNFMGKAYLHYTYFFFYLFLYIFFMNLVGLLPFTFAVTSSLWFTLFLSSIIWFSCLFKGLKNNGFRFFGHFCPTGVPSAIIPLITFIEVLSYFFRILSLGIRLFANIFAGHILFQTITLLPSKVFSFYGSFGSLTKLITLLLPIVFVFVLGFFELAVSFLQAYIFVSLSIFYLSETISSHETATNKKKWSKKKK